MKTKLLKLAAAGIALGMGISGNAQATSYGLAYANYLDGTIGFIDAGGNPLLPVVNAAVNTSESAATLTGETGESHSDIQSALGTPQVLADAAPSCLGSQVGCANNSWTPVGRDGTSYTRGDAAILSDQFTNPPTSTIQAVNIAEGEVIGTESGTASGSNSSQTEIVFSVNQTGSAVIAFNADPYMETWMDAEGQLVNTTLALSITIASATAGSLPFFEWEPNGNCQGGVGACTGITGGTELRDDTNINFTLTQLSDAGDTIYDPTGDASFTTDGGVGTANCNGLGTLCQYAAISAQFGPGTYRIVISESKFIRVSNVAVPEPTTLALMGIGIAGLGFSRSLRRRKIA